MNLKWLSLLLFCLFLMVTGTYALPYNNENVPSKDETVSHKMTVNDDDDDESDVVKANGDAVINVDVGDFGGFNADDEKGESLDEIIKKASSKAHGFGSTDTVNSSDPKNRLVNIEYDMIFTQEEFEERNTDSSKEKRTNAVYRGKQNSNRWKNHRIPFQFRPNTFTQSQKRQIIAAMSDWTKYTCLTFISASRGDRIYFTDGDTCSSHVGWSGGAQDITLAPGCRVKSVVTHEVGHAIGLEHEQTRPDRDHYVTVNTNNIKEDTKHNFKKKSLKKVENLSIYYDYLSIMHYGARAFSKNGKITIKTKDARYQNIIGQRKRLSFRDIKTVNWMYKCKEANQCTLVDGDCPGDGFVGKDCKCWCPGDPYIYCDMNAALLCKDYNPRCQEWANNNLCKSNQYRTAMTNKCPKACGLCKVCKDENVKCPAWAARGECKKSPRYMLSKCKKSCRVDKSYC